MLEGLESLSVPPRWSFSLEPLFWQKPLKMWEGAFKCTLDLICLLERSFTPYFVAHTQKFFLKDVLTRVHEFDTFSGWIHLLMETWILVEIMWNSVFHRMYNSVESCFYILFVCEIMESKLSTKVNFPQTLWNSTLVETIFHKVKNIITFSIGILFFYK